MRESLDGKQYVESYMQSLTHEIKSPLTAVRASAELLQEDPGPEDRRRFLRTIEEQTERMRQIVERLLLLARVEQLQVPEDARNLRLGDLLVNTLNSRASMMKARGLKVEIREESPGEVRGDPFLLQQALDNLIDNAIDFSPQGGSIEVVLTQAQTDGELSIRDEGPGAPAYALPQLFERFYSLPRPSTGQKSTGLGLSFVREVAKLHGGSDSWNPSMSIRCRCGQAPTASCSFF